MRHLLEREQFIPRPRTEVFAFFSRAENLARITPSSMRFEIKTPPPIAMRTGTIIDYRISLFGIGFPWKTLIESFEPETRFVDTALKSPYRYWHHEHTFEDATHDGRQGTRMRDRVTYEVPLGPLGELARAVFVRRQLESIFDYRHKTVAELFPPT